MTTKGFTPRTPSLIVRFINRPEAATKGKTFLFTIRSKRVENCSKKRSQMMAFAGKS